MAERRQKIRGTTIQLDQEIGLAGMLAVDVETNSLRLYDGVVMGGYKILNETEIALLYTLPTRLSEQGVSLAGAAKSANEALTNGWYFTDAATTDQPEAAAATIHVTTTAAGTVIAQTWIRGSNSNMYKRVRSAAGVWSAWNSVADATYLASAGATIYNANRLGGQLPAYYTAIAARLGYTPANKAGDTFTGPVGFNEAVAFAKGVTVAQTLAVTGVATFADVPKFTGTGGRINLSGATPGILFNQTDENPNYYLYVNGDRFYLLVDRDGDGVWDGAPYPLTIDDSDAAAYVYGGKVWTAANDGAGSGLDADTVDGVQAAALALAATSIIAGNGLSGGGTLAANRTLTLGTPGNITNSTTNSVSSTSHTHALGITVAEVYTGSSVDNTTFGLGHTLFARHQDSPKPARNASKVICLSTANNYEYATDDVSGIGTVLAGTWRSRGIVDPQRSGFQRTA